TEPIFEVAQLSFQRVRVSSHRERLDRDEELATGSSIDARRLQFLEACSDGLYAVELRVGRELLRRRRFILGLGLRRNFLMGWRVRTPRGTGSMTGGLDRAAAGWLGSLFGQSASLWRVLPWL